MGRPISKGLKYTCLDLNFFQDRKVRRLQRKCDASAPIVYIALLCTIFKEGYYVMWDEDFAMDLADATHMDEDYVNKVLLACFDIGLLSEEMFQNHRVLTSVGIQRQYEIICEQSKRKTRVDEYSLLEDVSSVETSENNPNQDVSSEETASTGGFPPEKVHKENKIKVKESKVNSFSSFPSSSEDLTEEQKEEEKIISFFTFSRNYCAPRSEYERMVAFNNLPGSKKKWSDLTGTEKQAIAELWHPDGETVTTHKPRYDPEFIKVWESFYKMLLRVGAPYDVRIAALDDKLKMTLSGGIARLYCPKQLRDWIENEGGEMDNLDHVKPIILPYINKHNSKLKYEIF